MPIQTDRYFIDRKKVNPDLFVIEIEICTCIGLFSEYTLHYVRLMQIDNFIIIGIYNWYFFLTSLSAIAIEKYILSKLLFRPKISALEI